MKRSIAYVATVAFVAVAGFFVYSQSLKASGKSGLFFCENSKKNIKNIQALMNNNCNPNKRFSISIPDSTNTFGSYCCISK